MSSSQEHLLFSCLLFLQLHTWSQFIVVVGTGLYIPETAEVFCIFFLLVCVRWKILKAATESTERNLKIFLGKSFFLNHIVPVSSKLVILWFCNSVILHVRITYQIFFCFSSRYSVHWVGFCPHNFLALLYFTCLEIGLFCLRWEFWMLRKSSAL